MTDKDITICGHGSGHPSLKNLNEYSTYRYNQIAPNGKHKGIVAVRRLKKLTDEKRPDFVNTYDIILGRNIYSQDLREFVYKKYKDGKNYSDCSSSGMATFEKIDVWRGSWYLNTAGIYESKDFKNVSVKIKNGHITNPEVLKVGDCILFAGSDPSRPLQIGHVEYVYKIKSDNDNKPKLDIAEPTLRKGDRGEEVALLQKNLNLAKCRDNAGNKLDKDGIFGQLTDQALRNFQREYGLVVDGIYGKKSAEKMNIVLNG